MKDNKIPILTYHNIDKVVMNDIYTISLSKFKEHIDWLSKEGYSTISLNNFIDWQSDSNNFPEKIIIITFDDGHRSCYELALSILKKYGFKATFFITTSWIGKEHYLRWDDIKTMKEMGMEFGSHSYSHTPLTQLSDREIHNELKVSKIELEENLNITIDFLSIPGGFFNDKIKKIAKELGYKAILTSKFGINRQEDDLYNLKRIGIRSYYSHLDLAKLLNNGILISYRLDLYLRKILKRSLGETQYKKIKQGIFEMISRQKTNVYP